MPELNVQKFLRNGGTAADLEAKYAISAKNSIKYPNLVLFKYNQIDSPFSEMIVRECRGLILDSANNWNVVSYPFNKFFNHGEGHAATIDWNTAKVYEKIDGSMMVLYHYDGKWHVQSSGLPDANGEVTNLLGVGLNKSFADLFWQSFKGLELPADPDINFIFELTTPENRVVVKHTDYKVTLIGARNRVTFEELDPYRFKEWPVVKSYNLDSLQAVITALEALNTTTIDCEGFVLCDANFNRVKVKNVKYVAMHHMKDANGPRNILEIVRNGEVAELTTYFPEYAEAYNKCVDAYNKLVADIETVYNEIKDIAIQKDFALKATKTRYSSVLFMLRSKKAASIKHALLNISIDRLAEIMDIK